ncbi:uncharacterized protein LOC125489994 [Plutella xylostella]|uniref:uncharacterized protein LOC125489994 n=1 Tax=Plutella xylostella TaxID=51655 RepID=UPI0020328FEB|nr:uncharacterized protein LOC125489994 [Plutella xylostella]
MKNSVLRKEYISFMREYEELGHMSVSKFKYKSGEEHFFIPHHAVFKYSGDVPKIRVVFNGSCVTSTGVSLNQCLHTGPKLQRDITDILFNFRRHKIIFICDVKQMFRQTVIDESDRKYQLILWWESPDQPLLTYELCTNTYGLRCSPYIANRTILELAEQERESLPRAAAVLRTDVYVDDIITGTDSESDALSLQQELITLMKSGGYELRKWISNSSAILQGLPDDHKQLPLLFENSENPHTVAVLGVLYDPVRDVFSYKLNLGASSSDTKRSILSVVARIFDPKGWICPVVYWVKCLLQRFWLNKLDWNDPLPSDLLREWQAFREDLVNLKRLAIPRCTMTKPASSYSLHGFCDASELGFAAVLYLRSSNQDGSVSVHLLMAKSKVAPLRTRPTIPKLELCGAVLLVKLLNHVSLCLQRSVEFEEIVGWTDSMISLAWINTSPHTLQVYEANRVSQIQNSAVTITWRHVPGNLNPADVASRGSTALTLLSHPLWWEPAWLTQNESAWPSREVERPSELPGQNT